MELKDTFVLVTGAASGMGAETARTLSKAGAKLILLDQNQRALAKLARELKAYYSVCDVSQAPSVETFFQKLPKEIGIPRVCVNCAGIAYSARVLGRDGLHNLEDFSRILDVNLLGTFNVLRLAARGMAGLSPLKTGERGVIINTASIAAFEGQIGQAAYSASKGGIVSMTLPLARELATFGIRVMAIAPGIFETPMMTSMSNPLKKSLMKATVFPKRLGQPTEFANLVQHIIENPMLNGEVIRLDGAIRLETKH